MQIGAQEILTPYPALGGDPTHYDPDFRAKVAHAFGHSIREADLPIELLQDKELVQHAKFLGELEDADRDAMELYRANPDNALVLSWASCNNGSQTRYYLDALLLTDQPAEVIAQDLGVAPEVVKLYERLYFNCRDDEFKMSLPARTKTALALGPLLELAPASPIYVQWRLAATQIGYSALVHRWGWEQDATGDFGNQLSMERNMWLAAMQVEQRLRSGQFSNEELFGVINGCLEYERVVLERQEHGNEVQAGMELLGSVLQAFAPKLIDNAATQDGLDESEQAQYRKLLAEHNISMQDVPDKGMLAAWEPINNELRARFKGVKA